jgi:hypothetical protein
VQSMLGAGISLNKAAGLRPVLERSGFSLTDRSHLASVIPKILLLEKQRIEQEIFDQYITFIFDGTTRLGEAVNIIYRYCPSDFSGVKLRLVDFTTLLKHMDGTELGQHLNEVLSSVVKVPFKCLVGASRDSCATNGAGLRLIKPLLPALFDFMCYSHMLHGTGTRFHIAALDDFLTPLLSIQSMAVVKSMYHETTRATLKGYSPIRWWSRWEVMNCLGAAFGKPLDGFIAALQTSGIAEDSTRKMQAVLGDAARRDAFEVELALVKDLEVFMTTTYNIEGDGLVILLVYDMIEKVRTLGRSLHTQVSLPNTAAVLRRRVKLSEGVRIRQYWSEVDAPGRAGWYRGAVSKKKPGHGQLCAVKYDNGEEIWITKAEEQTFRSHILAHELPEWQTCVDKIMPAFSYLDDRLTNNCDASYHMKQEHDCTKLCRAFDPLFASTYFDDVATLDEFEIVPAFKVHKLLDKMQTELPAYIAAAKSFSSNYPHGLDRRNISVYSQQVLKFWAENSISIPAWAVAARIVFSYSPNSAPCERVFSLLQAFFGKDRNTALADEISAALMLAYNERGRI